MSKCREGKIYKIVGNGLTYYGYTTQSLDKAFNIHNRFPRNYCCSQEVIITGDAKIVLVENYTYKLKIELSARVQFYIENNECVNKRNMPMEEKIKYQDNITKQFITYLDERKEQKRLNQFNKRHPN
jgi:hypothetical protein